MYVVSEECKKALNHYKRDLRFKLIIGDTIITENDVISFDIEEAIISSDDFELGGAVASILDLEINNIHGLYSGVDFTKKEIKIEIGIVLANGIVEYVPMGLFTIENSPEKGQFISIEATDKMVNFEKDYKSKLTYPTTVLQVLREVCNMAGVQLSTTNFYNMNHSIKSPINNTTLREVLHDIAEIAGGFAKINRYGKLEIVTPTNTDIIISKDNYMDLEIKDPFYIDNMTITESYIPVNPVPLNLNVVPFTAKWQGNISLDVGDIITLDDDKKLVKTIVTKQRITFNGGVNYESECSGLSEQQKDTQHISNQKKTNERFESEIKQNADSIAMKVSSDDFNTYKEQTDREIKQKVSSGTGFSTEFKQNIEGFDFIIGDETLSFKKGEIKAKFKDGSVATISADGFYNMFGTSKREYHHLSYSGEVQIPAYSGSGSGSGQVTVQLPDEFKNKNYVVTPSVRKVETSSSNYAIRNFECFVTFASNTEYKNGRFIINGYLVETNCNDSIITSKNNIKVVYTVTA